MLFFFSFLFSSFGMDFHTLMSTASTLCWCVALLPQIYHNYSTKSVHGLSPYLLLLWLLGDTCNLIGCILTNQLPFQTYLSCYFVLSDIILDLQYIYYHKNNISNDDEFIEELTNSSIEMLSEDGAYYTTDNTIENISSNTTAFTPILSKTQLITTTTALISISPASAIPIISTQSSEKLLNTHYIGLLFAWLCTIIYCSSRLPQLYHNYQRKSVDGVSPLLFTFALLANLTYAISILTTELPLGLSYKDFILRELPYLLGSLGTVFCDLMYFWQREFYKQI